MASFASADPPASGWRRRFVATVDHREVMARIRDDSSWGGRYLFMVLVSAAIALLGLLLSSPAVVIGAMLISPLMGPIIGLGFALATADALELRRAAVAMAAGTVLAVLLCAAMVLASPLQNVTPEIAARTRPNLFDLMVALFSALAGAYATIRGRAGTVVGVAIATALMPPLGVVGFGLATANWPVFQGAALLFLTNLMTIALTAAVMARVYGFGPRLSPHQTLLQSVVLVALFAALAVPLGIALRQVAREALVSRNTREVLGDLAGREARLGQVDIDYDARPIRVSATLFTSSVRTDIDRDAARRLSSMLGRPVTVRVEQLRVATGQADAKAAQASSEAQQQAAAQAAAAQAATSLADRLALVAGVTPDAVTLDLLQHRAIARAQPLPDAGLATYRSLEARVAAAAPDWSLTLIPPASATLPAATTRGADGTVAVAPDEVATIGWGAARLGLSVAVPAGRRGDVVARALQAAKIPVVRAGTGALGWTAASAPPVPAGQAALDSLGPAAKVSRAKAAADGAAANQARRR